MHTATLVGTKLFIGYNTCHMFDASRIHSFCLMLCAACFVGKGLGLILLLGWLLLGWETLGLKS